MMNQIIRNAHYNNTRGGAYVHDPIKIGREYTKDGKPPPSVMVLNDGTR